MFSFDLKSGYHHVEIALPFFSTTDGVLKMILKCAAFSRMPLELTFPRRVSYKRVSVDTFSEA